MAIKSELFFLITHTHTYIYIYREYTTTRYRFETGNEYKVIGWKRDYHPVSLILVVYINDIYRMHHANKMYLTVFAIKVKDVQRNTSCINLI